MNAIASLLIPVVGRDNIWFSPEDMAAYSVWPCKRQGGVGGGGPLAVVRPVNLEQVSELLAILSREQIPMAFRGSGTSFDAPANIAGRVLVLGGGLKRILDCNVRNRTLTVQAGVSSAEILQTLSGTGLCFPPMIPLGSMATVGGSLAMDRATQRTAKYGGISSHVESLEVITAAGKRFECLAQNSAPGLSTPGFPLAKLVCGSCGRLAFIGKAKLRLLPAPVLRRDMLIHYPDFESAAAAVYALLEARTVPVVLEVLHGLNLPVAGNLAASGKTCVWLGVEGQIVDWEARECLALLTGGANSQVRQLSVSQVEELARAYMNPGALAAKGGKLLWLDLRCPPDKIPAMAEGIGDVMQRHRLAWSAFGPLLLSRLELFIYFQEPALAESAARELFILERILNGHDLDEEELAQGREQWKRGENDLYGLCEKLGQVLDPHGLLGDRQ